MARILVPATPLLGHLGPVLGVATALRDRGHHVDVLTDRSAAALVRHAGLGFVALHDDHRPASRTERRRGLALPWAAPRDDVIRRFVLPLRGQAAAVSAALHRGRGYDLVLAETAFLGVLPMLLSPAHLRVPVIGLSVTPLSFVSSAAPPFGSGLRHADSRFARRRNAQVNWLLHRGPLRPLQVALDEALRPWDVRRGAANYFDLVGDYDQCFQLGLPELEYPRDGLPATVQCVGPVPLGGVEAPLPAWWPDLDSASMIIHLTQGTVDNGDLRRLIRPAVRALADRDAVVIISTSRSAEAIRDAVGGRLPANVRVAPLVPYHRLLPRTSLMITNGGWGGVQQAARHGVPIIVAGATEEKPEVAARVAWAGIGLDVGTGRPTVGQLRRAVDQVIGDPRFARQAARLKSAADTRPDPISRVLDAIDASLVAGACDPAESNAS